MCFGEVSIQVFDPLKDYLVSLLEFFVLAISVLFCNRSYFISPQKQFPLLIQISYKRCQSGFKIKQKVKSYHLYLSTTALWN